MNFTFYILYSTVADRYYIGHTSQLIEERVENIIQDIGVSLVNLATGWWCIQRRLERRVKLIDGRFKLKVGKTESELKSLAQLVESIPTLVGRVEPLCQLQKLPLRGSLPY